MDLYVILGVGHGATDAEIRRAYRRLARRFHPDINPGDRLAEVRFREILTAYEVLIDPARRSRYDAGDTPDLSTPRPASGFEGFDFSRRGSDHSATFGDLFADVLASQADALSAPQRGADLHTTVEVSFDDAFRGVARAVTVTRRETCAACRGAGTARVASPPCVLCDGTGVSKTVRGHMVFTRGCQGCGGTGRQRPRACDVCGGAGFDTRAESVPVSLPAGVVDGVSLRVAGKGHAGTRGGPAGDLYITVRVQPHPVFRREGDDVHMTVAIAVHEAALGARIEIPVPDGHARLRVPPGTQSGQRFRLRERGMVSNRDGRRGDLLVDVRIVLPAVLDERSKALLREFARLNPDDVRHAAADRASV